MASVAMSRGSSPLRVWRIRGPVGPGPCGQEPDGLHSSSLSISKAALWAKGESEHFRAPGHRWLQHLQWTLPGHRSKCNQEPTPVTVQVVSLFGHKSLKKGSILERKQAVWKTLSFMGSLSENQLLHLNQAKKVGFLGEQSQAFHLSSDENSYWQRRGALGRTSAHEGVPGGSVKESACQCRSHIGSGLIFKRFCQCICF